MNNLKNSCHYNSVSIMDLFLKFILKITTLLRFPKNIHIILCNESTDLDSTVSALALSYFIDKNICDNSENSVALPVLNVGKKEFLLRTENCFVLNKIGINLSTLYYQDTLNIKDLVEKHNVKVSLVDHHVLSKQMEYLRPNVVGIYDHRPVDVSSQWGDDVEVNIKLVGSCATLITEEIFSKNSDVLSPSLANILYDTIIFDTIALSPTAGKVKDLDIEMSKKLEMFLKLEQPNHKELFNVLWSAHNDVSNLTPRQLLVKDLKIIEKILIPGLPMLVKDFLKLPDVLNTLDEFFKEKNGTIVILMGLEAKCNEINRDIAFYSLQEDSTLLNFIVDNLKQNELLQLFEESSNVTGILYFTQNHIPSRKQLMPLVRDLLAQFHKSNKDTNVI